MAQAEITSSECSEKSSSGSGFERKPVFDVVKRICDIIISILCLTVGLPVYLIIIIAIVADDFGNPFYVQERVGMNGRSFKMLKFRTMHKDADKLRNQLDDINEYNDVHFKSGNDPRVTRVGKFLRATSLDETPQAVNILLGDMSVVGPRPFIAEEQSQLPDDRLVIKPGLSCYWQIANTAKMSIDEQLELDYKYIRERSVLTDIKIIVKTAVVVFRGKNC